MNSSSKPVYEIVQGSRTLRVYEDCCVISTKSNVESFLNGNLRDGEKTIYYCDCVGIQFKEGKRFTVGYIQLETASALISNKDNKYFNENTFSFNINLFSNEYMREVADYIRGRIAKTKSQVSQNEDSTIHSLSSELLKLKELLDMGILTKEEFDAKKKQLLGL